MSVIIIHRPSAAAKELVASVMANPTPALGHAGGLLLELANKPSLTECEAFWFKHECSQLLIETVPA